MLTNDTIKKTLFGKSKIVPVVTINDVTQGVLVAQALIKGGIHTIEVTLRTPKALEVIAAISHEVPEILVGAGTVLTVQQYQESVKHGAKFIVSPGLSESLIHVAKDNDVFFLPGAVTPSEVMRALEHDIKLLKFFPANAYNAMLALSAFASVFPQVEFCPTGGISLTNVQSFIALKNVVGAGCSYLVKNEDLLTGNYSNITKLAQQINILVSKE